MTTVEDEISALRGEVARLHRQVTDVAFVFGQIAFLAERGHGMSAETVDELHRLLAAVFEGES